MKKSQVTIGFAIILLLGFALGYRVKDKFDKRKGIEAVLSENIGRPIQRPDSKLKIKDINFIIRKNNAGNITDPDKKAELEKILSTGRLKLHFVLVARTLEEAKNANRAKIPTQMGLLDALRVAELEQQGNPAHPVFAASSKDKMECFSEIQVVSNSNVHSLEDLTGKTIGVEQVGVNLSSGIFKKLQGKGITVKKMVIYSAPQKALSDLSSHKIDVLFDRVTVYSNGEIISKLSATNNRGTYIGYPTFQIIHSTANKIPCKVVFISPKLSKETTEELKSKLVGAIMNADTRQAAREGLDIESLTPITTESWKPVAELFKQIMSFQPRTFAEDVVTE